MTRIICQEDCGNAPKRLQIKQLLTAMAKANSRSILRHFTDDILLEAVGGGRIEGKQAAAAHFARQHPASELVIHNILTHGAAGAANGVIIAAGGKRYEFCDVYHFASHAKAARIRVIKSYVIET